ncbi:HsdM family class I SAM-dependent methyltransferase [Sanyastnella coralliicola]|uniref:HsdM family class I SAM-dependent methyltransferase n=1 Tax=Sanyastnella coralliicola TaxID=3069118 RepID=UPI0027B8DCAD|nr:N-6 DNA methylase [Longitalea sp. SCSIO 12813]
MIKEYGQYYTEGNIAKLLISSVRQKKPEKIIELGVGKGALMREAMGRWERAEFFGADVDRNNVKQLQYEFPNVEFLELNGLSFKIDSELSFGHNTIDVAICNPPYRQIDKAEHYGRVLENAQLGSLNDYKKLSSDLIFLARNLTYLKNGGELAIILPNGLITSHEFKGFRKNLLKNHDVTSVIELPDRVFKNTDAKTYILIVRKGRKNKDRTSVQVKIADSNGTIEKRHEVQCELLIERMDYTYHDWRISEQSKANGKSLKELNVLIRRGSYSKRMLVNLNTPFLHTSDISGNKGNSVRLDKKVFHEGMYAEKGDIVMTRVGRTNLGKVLYVKSGRRLISDCVYVLRAPTQISQDLYSSLSGREGRAWIEAHKRGVCAKVISKTDLLNYVLFE